MRTQLHITAATRALAETSGAYFDPRLQAWFVDGDVPAPLLAFCVKTARTRDSVAEAVPQCRECGAQMVLKTQRYSRNIYYRCAACQWTRSLLAGDAAPADRRMETKRPALPDFEDKQMAAAVVARAHALFSAPGDATRWLELPKVGLRDVGGTPLLAIRTVAGCSATDKLLDERFE